MQMHGLERTLRLRRPNEPTPGGRTLPEDSHQQQQQQQQQQQGASPQGERNAGSMQQGGQAARAGGDAASASAGPSAAAPAAPAAGTGGSGRRGEGRQPYARGEPHQAHVQGGSRVRTRVVPPSFVDVIDALVEVVMAEPAPQPPQQQQQQQAGQQAGSTDMDVEAAHAQGAAVQQQQQQQQAGQQAPQLVGQQQQQQQQQQQGRGLPSQHPLLEALKSADALVAYLRAYPPQAAAQVRACAGWYLTVASRKEG